MDNLLTIVKISLSSLAPRNSDGIPEPVLLFRDKQSAAELRNLLGESLAQYAGPSIFVLDLDGVTWTPSVLQEFILPLAQRIRGGEFGNARLTVASSDQGVRDSVSYMAQAHQLPLYVTGLLHYFEGIVPAGSVTQVGRETLDAILRLGGQVSASTFAQQEGIGASAAQNRLVNLQREGYLVRHQRSRREGDMYVEPGRFLRVHAKTAVEPQVTINLTSVQTY